MSHDADRPDAVGTGAQGAAATAHPAPAPTVGAAQLLRNPGFVGLLVYRLLGMLSYQIVAVTVGWHVY